MSAPLIFSGAFLDAHAVSVTIAVTLLFCIAASAVYIVNDLHDVEADRRHPRKSQTRPIAAGVVSRFGAMSLLLLLYGLICTGVWFEPRVGAVVAIYVLMNLAYTFVLKHQPVIDIFTVALGFVLRVYAGAQAIAVPVSGWMFVTTLCLALYLAAVKRRQELLNSGKDGRAVLQQYSSALIDRYAEMSATGALVFYSLFVVSARPALVITVPFVLFGLFRYWYVVDQLDGGESPTDALVGDWQLLLTVALWVATCIWAEWPAA